MSEQQKLLEQSVIAVSGAGGGIGGEVARVLGLAGARISLCDLNSTVVERVVAELQAQGVTAAGHVVDLTRRAEVNAWIGQTEQTLGPIGALVNVAGLWRPKAVDEISEDDWLQTIACNLTSAFFCCQTVIPGMRERKNGAIVNFASTAGEYGSISPAAHYAAAKGGIIALTKSLAREVSPFGVRVNAISPGPIDTLALGAASAEQKAIVAQRTLVGRLGTPADIAQGVLYLVSPGASFVTGHVLRVNGGSLL